MGLFKKNKNVQSGEVTNKHAKQVGLQIRLPGCKDFVPIGKWQYKRIYVDDIGPRLLCVLDECAELIEPSGVKTQEGKEEDALKQEIVGLIKSITQLGRSSGMHCILAPLSLDTVIPTVNGYTTMRDIDVGETVFLPNGSPVKVLDTSPVKLAGNMYRLNLCTYSGLKYFNATIKADGDHCFPVLVRGQWERCNMYKIIALFRQAYNLKIRGAYDQIWSIDSIESCESEPVKCILVDDESHQFLITGDRLPEWKGGGRWDENIVAISSFNTQRNDASIIPGVIQNNSLAIDTQLRIRRKIEDNLS